MSLIRADLQWDLEVVEVVYDRVEPPNSIDPHVLQRHNLAVVVLHVHLLEQRASCMAAREWSTEVKIGQVRSANRHDKSSPESFWKNDASAIISASSCVSRSLNTCSEERRRHSIADLWIPAE